MEVKKELPEPERQKNAFASLVSYKHEEKLSNCDGKCWSRDIPKNKNDEKCEHICGNCFYYDRYETEFYGITVCTKYPCDCGPNCINGWHHKYLLIRGTEYLCRDGIKPD